MTSKDSAERDMSEPRRGWLGRAGARLHQLVCGLHGHDPLMHFQRGRVSLRCICGYETPGWDVRTDRGAGPVSQTPRMLHLPRARERRVA
jgi:hypothetical protein